MTLKTDLLLILLFVKSLLNVLSSLPNFSKEEGEKLNVGYLVIHVVIVGKFEVLNQSSHVMQTPNCLHSSV